MQENFYKKDIYFEHITYSKNFSKIYEKFSGADLLDDLLYLFYQDKNDININIAKVNCYHKAFRLIMKNNDECMYSLTKSILGEKTFFGEHPTWWGNNYKQNFENFKNGFYWWEAKRDIAQTDEIVIMPIRTALAHKWQSPFWYNMWYSMGTRDIKSYFKETWNNVRYGGRTHYLAYECPNESVVLELYKENFLEQIEEMDKIVRTTDEFQLTQPDCRVLIVFGIENCINWFFSEEKSPPWYPTHKYLTPALKSADKIFDEYLCDMIPSSEIENGSLKLIDGKPVYGTQQYDIVVVLAPDSMGEKCYDFLHKLNKNNVIIAGKYNIYSSGKKLSSEDKKLMQAFENFSSCECYCEIIESLKKRKIKANRFSNGCVFQDGSLIFTAEGDCCSGNSLVVDVVHENKNIKFVGEDLLFCPKNANSFNCIFPKGKLKIN